MLLAVTGLAGCTEPTAPGAGLRCGAEPVSLEPGDVVRSGKINDPCRLAAAPGALYALAVIDASAIESARNGFEEAFDDYVVGASALALGTSAPLTPAVPAPSFAGRAAEPVSDVASVALIDTPADRTTPWTLDEQFELRHPGTNQLETARVVRIFEGRYVVAWFEQGDPARLAAELPMIDSAFGPVSDIAIPMLRSTFLDTEPRSSVGAGQYLILLADTLGPGLTGRAFRIERDGQPLTWIAIKLGRAGASATGSVSLITHEMAHSWQFMHMYATRAGGSSASSGASFWAVEGGANTMSYFVMGRAAGIAPDANLDWRAAQPTPAATSYARRAQPLLGEFTAGYDNAMGFLRRLVLQRMAAGETLEQALRQVSRGAIEGWFGFDGASMRPGLTARMREVDGDWEPVSAMLDWTLSHVADDRTPNAELQDRASLRVWDIPVGTIGWSSGGFLNTAIGTVERERRYGSPLFIYVQDQGTGLEVRVTATRWFGTPQATPIPHAWALVRLQ